MSTSKRKLSRRTSWVTAAALSGALLGSAGVAMAQSDGSTAPSTTTAPATDAKPTDRVAETPLTGDIAAKVTAAAQAAVPGGTIDRVETDSDGSPYEAHVTKSDGTKVTVKVDANFAVTSIDDH